MSPGVIIIATLVGGPVIILALAFGPSIARSAIDDARARHRQRLTKRYGLPDRETVRSIGIGGASDLIHKGEQ